MLFKLLIKGIYILVDTYMRFFERGRELIAAQVVDVVDLNNPCCFVLQCHLVYSSLFYSLV